MIFKQRILSKLQMSTQFKYGLKNGSMFLKQFLHEKHHQQPSDIQTVHEKTFGQEQFSINKLQPELDLNQEPKQLPEQYPRVSEQPIKLSEVLILQHFKETLKVYEEDLEKLEENKQTLIEAIQQLAGKIESIPDMHSKNQNLELENFKEKKNIQALIKQYHSLKLQLKEKQTKATTNLFKKQEKLKKLMDLMEPRVEERVIVESEENYQYQIAVNQWTSRTMNLENSGPFNETKQTAIIQKILKQPKKQPQASQKKKKPTKQREGLLGDLKSFSRNFKMP